MFPSQPMVSGLVEPMMEAAGIEPAQGSPGSISFVYFIQVGDDGPIKIGLAKNIDRRLAELQSASPYELFVIGFVRTRTPLDTEQYFHCLFREHRIRGEWFEPAREILNFIAQSVDEVLAGTVR